MRRAALCLLAPLLLCGAGFPPTDAPIGLEQRPQLDAPVAELVDRELPRVRKLYELLHSEPELSLQETETARRMADHLRRAGFEVTEKVGGTGVVAVMRNGEGPGLLVRADMDALPVTEATGLRYASKEKVAEEGGGETGVMHACGHDVHMGVLVGTARILQATRDRWRGTAVLIAQPAEEIGAGARAMIADGLFERFGVPDHIIGLHVEADLPAGTVGITPGWVNANVDSVDITIFGRGGHGARPHQARDPVVAAAAVVQSLQTLVSRRVPPIEDAVVTVGSIRGGTRHNVIPDQVHLQLTVRSYTDAVRKTLLDGIREIAEHTCAAMRCVRKPDVVVREQYTPAAYNHPGLAEGAAKIFARLFGDERVWRPAPSMGGEDFGRYSRETGKPGLMFRLGTVDPKTFARTETSALPSLHSARFAPDVDPTLRTGMRAMSALALSLLGERQ